MLANPSRSFEVTYSKSKNRVIDPVLSYVVDSLTFKNFSTNEVFSRYAKFSAIETEGVSQPRHFISGLLSSHPEVAVELSDKIEKYLDDNPKRTVDINVCITDPLGFDPNIRILVITRKENNKCLFDTGNELAADFDFIRKIERSLREKERRDQKELMCRVEEKGRKCYFGELCKKRKPIVKEESTLIFRTNERGIAGGFKPKLEKAIYQSFELDETTKESGCTKTSTLKLTSDGKNYCFLWSVYEFFINSITINLFHANEERSNKAYDYIRELLRHEDVEVRMKIQVFSNKKSQLTISCKDLGSRKTFALPGLDVGKPYKENFV